LKLKATNEPIIPAETIQLPGDIPELSKQISRIVKCPAFSNSDILRGLLLFLGQAALERPGENIREQEIAENVLGKTDFDPRIDSGVRVHAGRLRSKLAEYYLGEGKDDPLIVELSKGSYQLVYRPRISSPEEKVQVQVEPQVPSPVSAVPGKSFPFSYLLLASLMLAGLAFAGWSYKKKTSHPIPQEIEQFWAPFLYGERQPIVVFGGPRSGSTQTQWTKHEEDMTFTSSWAGVGALFSVHRLTHIFTSLDKTFILKRSLNLNWDDARQEPLILIGGPESNSAHSSLPKTKRFVFFMNEEARVRTTIQDLKAKDDSSKYYTVTTHPIQQDYAIIAYLPTLSPDRPMIIAAGITTFGTQAAIEFLTEKHSLRTLRSGFNMKNDAFPYFEALIKVTVRDGVPIHSELIAVEKW